MRPSLSRLLLRHGVALGRARTQQIRRAGLKDTDGMALTHLIETGGLTADELGRRLALGAAPTLELVEALEQGGFIARRAAAAGVAVLAPTPLAHATLVPVAAAVPDLRDPDDRAVVHRFFAELAAATEQAAASLAEDDPDLR